MSVVICGLYLFQKNRSVRRHYINATSIHNSMALQRKIAVQLHRCDMLFFFIKEYIYSLIELTYEALSVMDTLPLIPNKFA